MHGVGTGRLVAGRYALKERRATLGVIEVWLATDSTLEREVSVTVFPTMYDRAQAILEAARNSAVVNDPRFVRVLDVGTRGDVSWLIEESLSESTSVADLLQQGPLPPEEARRIAGETASALEVARRHGLHHLHLTPHAVRRTTAGLIKVAGLSTAAAVEGTQEPPADEAARQDTVAVIALLYAALTTRWPLKSSVPGLQPAPRIAAGVAPPSEIAVAVPADLDALCRTTFTAGAGPRTPQEAIAALSPWSHTLVKQLSPKPAAAGLTQEIPKVPSGVGARPAAASRAQSPTTTDRRPTHREMRAHERAAKAAETRREIAARRRDPGYLDLPEALAESSGPPEPPAPLLAAAPLETEGAHAKLVLAIVLGVLLLAMAFAIPSLTNALTAATSPRAPHSPSATPTGAPAATPSASPSSPSSASPRSSTPTAGLTLSGARALDPGGDGKENDGQAARTVDGDPATIWQSEGYKAADFQGQKDGVGLSFALPTGATPTTVTLTFPDTPQNAEVYVGSKRSKDGATLAGSVTDATGQVSVDLPAATADARYLIVWFPQAARDSDGKFRASLADVAVS